jgi:hypothetical protein
MTIETPTVVIACPALGCTRQWTFYDGYWAHRIAWLCQEHHKSITVAAKIAVGRSDFDSYGSGGSPLEGMVEAMAARRSRRRYSTGMAMKKGQL